MRGRAQRAALALLTPGNSLIKVKGFRAVTARATFLCLCKETWRKESTPRLRARCVAPGPRSRRDFPRGHPAPAENAAPPCAAPCGSCPPAPPLRRGPEDQGQRTTATTPATPPCRSGISRQTLISRTAERGGRKEGVS